MVTPMTRMEVHFDGRVQGVGFRFSVVSIAARFSVTGYVKNLHNGLVEIVAEGDDAELNDFMRAIMNSELQRYIVTHTVDWFKADGSFKGFTIQY